MGGFGSLVVPTVFHLRMSKEIHEKAFPLGHARRDNDDGQQVCCDVCHGCLKPRSECECAEIAAMSDWDRVRVRVWVDDVDQGEFTLGQFVDASPGFPPDDEDYVRLVEISIGERLTFDSGTSGVITVEGV